MEVKQIHPNLFNGTYSPHCIRHLKAMHLVNNGVPLSTIRAFFGHEVLTSTQIYATPDLNTMRKELEKNSKNLNINIKYTKKEKETLDKFLEEILKK